MKNYRYIIFTFILIITHCAGQKEIKSEKVTINGIEILYGKLSAEQLFFDYPEWKQIYSAYNPDMRVIDSLNNNISHEIGIDIFLGTWCGDSKREVPRFLNILDKIKNFNKKNLHLYAVNRKKKLDSGLATKKNISRVATFIIKKNEREIGRIVEFPIENLEKDFLNILINKELS